MKNFTLFFATLFVAFSAMAQTPITVAEFIEKPVNDNVWYELTGTITNLTNTNYGNFDLVDETGKVYVWGLKENKDAGKTTFSNLGLSVGDKIKLHGTRGDYNGKVEVMNAYFVELVEKGEGEPEQPKPEEPAEGEPGSEADPYTIEEAIANQGAKNNGVFVWVEGYIVGFVGGMNMDALVYGAEADSVYLTNLVIAAEPGEPATVLPVQLPKENNIRSSLNLHDNPSNLGKKVKLQGTLEPYFSVAGIKNVKKASFVEGESTAVENVAISNIYTENGMVVVEGEHAIFTVTGQDVTAMNGRLENGIYIVKTANLAVKVVVK